MTVTNTSKTMPSEAEVMGYFKALSNWGRWGAQDRLGTLNYITPEKRVQASSLVKKGLTVSCSRMMLPENTPDMNIPSQHFMTITGEGAPAKGRGAAGDYIGMNVHGTNITHIDALCHIFWDGKSYNGIDAKKVTNRGKATQGGIEVLEHGVVTRGVFLDIAKLRNQDWMKAGDTILPEDLESAETAAKVKVQPGDALLYRTGWTKAREVQGPPTDHHRPGLHAACLPWLHERRVSLIAADAATDVVPTGYEGTQVDLPIHSVGIAAMGLWILDGANFEMLAEVCHREKRYEFLFLMAPLRWRYATGSPVNPIAVL